MLFMGEEWGSKQPFLFFSDLSEKHRKKTRDLHHHEANNAPPIEDESSVPDPFDDETFVSARLAWEEVQQTEHAEWLAFYRKLIDLRRREIVPRLLGMGEFSGRCEVFGHRGLRVSWKMGDGSQLELVANLGNEQLGCEPWRGRNLWLEGYACGTSLEPWSLLWNLIEAPQG
jgi:maltooligosyltrehalose trehalohydrolase